MWYACFKGEHNIIVTSSLYGKLNSFTRRGCSNKETTETHTNTSNIAVPISRMQERFFFLQTG